ncbi:MAG: hypothetical protein K2Q32_04420 [Alphaproteobacteria bacterium]|nr:hypothetical protein [Alphaproteobacteria bacterium]
MSDDFNDAPPDRPYKPLVMFIDIQRLYAAPPTPDEVTLLEKYSAHIPTDDEIKRVQDIIIGCNQLADYLRGSVKIGWAAMAPKTSFLVTQSVDEFRILLVSNGHNQLDFYMADPKDGDLMVAKTKNSVMSNPEFMMRLQQEGYTHIYFAGFQATECALSGALKDAVWEMFEEAAHHIQTAIISDLSADTFAGKSTFRPMPDTQVVQEKMLRLGARLVTTHECLAEIQSNLGRPVKGQSPEPSATPII